MNIEFNSLFSLDNVKKIYITKIYEKSSVGIDKITSEKFIKNLETNLSTINRKVLNGTYKFTAYRELLILKGRDKYPRVISIPTIRDKIVIEIIKQYLQQKVGNKLYAKIPQVLINEIKTSLNDKELDMYIKLDISNFYGSLSHSILLQKLNNLNIDNNIIELIKKIIECPTVAYDTQKTRQNIVIKGIPQGIAISNILSSIYMNDLDIDYLNKNDIKYLRYIDDILLLVKENIEQEFELIKNKIKTEYFLELNEEKSKKDIINSGFQYLGYYFKNDLISVREGSIHKLEKSIERIFKDFSHSKEKNVNLLLWKLNLKITGAIKNKRKYGWVFYFSQLTDLTVLFHLDVLVKKLIIRFNISNCTTKTFSRTYNEIINNLSNTTYIPNFDKYSESEKEYILFDVFKSNIVINSNEMLQYEFDKLIFCCIKELEKDIQDIS